MTGAHNRARRPLPFADYPKETSRPLPNLSINLGDSAVWKGGNPPFKAVCFLCYSRSAAPRFVANTARQVDVFEVRGGKGHRAGYIALQHERRERGKIIVGFDRRNGCILIFLGSFRRLENPT